MLWAVSQIVSSRQPCLTCFADYTEIGIGVKQDMDLAKRWYMRAAGMYLFSRNEVKIWTFLIRLLFSTTT